MLALVVDDSRTTRRILARYLRQWAYEVCEASDGKAALELMARLPPPNVILVDWNMPEMDGLEFVRCLRSNPAWAQIPVVMVTTETEMDRIQAALASGVNEYVMKPFSPEVISEKLMLLQLVAEGISR